MIYLYTLFKQGLNPHITYTVEGRSDFEIIDGYLFLTKSLSDGSFSLQVSLSMITF